jgi:mannose-6-phosphate isomerase-like protein (cupin superfamily)
MRGILLDTNSAAAYALSDMRDTQAIEKVSLAEKLGSFQDYWSPKVVGAVNDSFVKLVKLKGEFVWHHHDAEDELFLVIKGTLLMKLRDRDVRVEEGEFIIIPRGVEHLPVAEDEVHVLLLEPKSTLNTGNVVNERTVADLDRL